MDDRTRHFYETHAEEVSALWEDSGPGVTQYFSLAFPPGARILDIGAGTGRDLAMLVAEGFEAYGTEPVAELRAVGMRLRPQVMARVSREALPDGLTLGGSDERPFEGIVCSAVLQHLPRSELFDSVFAMRAMLSPGGRVLISVPLNRPGLDQDGREPGGRLFNGVSPGELTLLFERAGFATIDSWTNDDGAGRSGHQWSTLLFRLRGTTGSRPLDLVEGVLSRDRKVTTYKLALFRALADVALAQPHRAIWELDGMVSVPLDAIAERWIAYYWPLFESAAFLPQGQGEWQSQRHGLRFARELQALMDAALWREFALMGHWIRDALILRWAELTVRFARGEVNLEVAVACLMSQPVDERETSDARRVYGELDTLECVWSGKVLTGREFAVDHLVPFALWRNNDLWNLLPTDEKVNAKKSDRLPTRNLLRDRRPTITDYWEITRTVLPIRFASEAAAMTGFPEPSESLLFATLLESVEAAALQRGCQRWEP